MKKVKIMLTAIAVLAVVGGALAFKAQKFSGIWVFQKTQNSPNATCPIVAEFTTLGTGEIENFTIAYSTNQDPGLATTVSPALCTNTFNVRAE